jgi:hypothetical protein
MVFLVGGHLEGVHLMEIIDEPLHWFTGRRYLEGVP